MNNKILPIGSVIKLKDGDGTELMIIARASIIEDENEEVYYDYCSVLLPQGLSTQNDMYFFNREQVGEVLFRGYENEVEVKYQDNYDDIINSITLEKGKVK